MTRLLRSSDKIDITQYLPPFLKKDPHFRAVCEACSWEHENIRNAILDALNQFFVEKATWGLSMWEQVLDLHPSPEDTYCMNLDDLADYVPTWCAQYDDECNFYDYFSSRILAGWQYTDSFEIDGQKYDLSEWY